MFTWPENKSFAFTIIDDTDNATVENIKPVYDLLKELGIKCTKSVWVYPPRDGFVGDSLADEHYLKFVQSLSDEGFELCLHGVGSGDFSRSEIQEGINLFERSLGVAPLIHVNHSMNKDNIYWGYKRFVAPIRQLMRLLSRHNNFSGDNPSSPYFWGDICRDKIQFIRNHTFNGIRTHKYDPHMPYTDRSKKYSNYWFSSSDGNSLETFCDLLSDENILKLKNSGGFCIVYTHFASGFVRDGEVNPFFKERLSNLCQHNGWFVPAGTLLKHLLLAKPDHKITWWAAVRLDAIWLTHKLHNILTKKHKNPFRHVH